MSATRQQMPSRNFVLSYKKQSLIFSDQNAPLSQMPCLPIVARFSNVVHRTISQLRFQAMSSLDVNNHAILPIAPTRS